MQGGVAAGSGGSPFEKRCEHESRRYLGYPPDGEREGRDPREKLSDHGADGQADPHGIRRERKLPRHGDPDRPLPGFSRTRLPGHGNGAGADRGNGGATLRYDREALFLRRAFRLPEGGLMPRTAAYGITETTSAPSAEPPGRWTRRTGKSRWRTGSPLRRAMPCWTTAGAWAWTGREG